MTGTATHRTRYLYLLVEPPPPPEKEKKHPVQKSPRSAQTTVDRRALLTILRPLQSEAASPPNRMKGGEFLCWLRGRGGGGDGPGGVNAREDLPRRAVVRIRAALLAAADLVGAGLPLGPLMRLSVAVRSLRVVALRCVVRLR